MTGLSIVIPALNAAATIGGAIAHLRETGADGDEILLADGGSTDGTPAAATKAGADRLLAAPRGRGPQLRAGGAAARGDWLLFLHADTRPGVGWRAAAAEFMADPANADRAAYFRFALDDADPRARRIERLVAWRCRKLALPYGDQGLLISRSFYDALGGYDPVPLMEDVRLVRRIGRRRLEPLDVPAVTSAARYRRDGYTWRPVRNVTCLILHFLGVPPRWLARLYG